MNDSAPPADRAPRDNVTLIEQAVDAVGRDLLLACLGELRQAKKVFDDQTEKQQTATINRLREVVAGALRRGFAIMTTAGFPCTQATLEKVAFTVKGVQGTLSLATTSSDRHALSDHAGQPVVVVLASAERYMAKIGEVQASPDQGALPLGEAQDTSGFNSERHAPPAETAEGGEPAAPPAGASVDVVDQHPGAYTLDVVADVMALIGMLGALETMAAWTQEERCAVVDFCAAVHLKERGHDVAVPARPAVLGEAV